MSISGENGAGGLLERVRDRLSGDRPLAGAELLAAWSTVSALGADGRTYELLADRFLRLGEPLVAYDVAREGTRRAGASLRLSQLLGLALARSGVPGRANEVLAALQAEGHADGETLGLLARTHKDLWERSGTAGEGAHHLELAHGLYRRAFEAACRDGRDADAIYTGINAATTARLSGDESTALEVARAVEGLCRRATEADGPAYWTEAALGEAALIRRGWADAEKWYARAAATGRGQFGDLASTRRNARLLLSAMGEDAGRLDRCFDIPPVVIFSSPVPVPSESPAARLTALEEEELRRTVAGRPGLHGRWIGYCAGLCEADAVFMEETAARGAELHVVLPCPLEAGPAEAGCEDPVHARLRRAARGATSVVIAADRRRSAGPVVRRYAARMAEGLAILRARMLETDLCPLGAAPASAAQPADAVAGAPCEAVMAMLFADVSGYARLSEEQIPRFIDVFMGKVAALANRGAYHPVMRNTWGDALFFVFERIRDAGCFALALSEMAAGIDWAGAGLHPEMDLRMALDAGPVLRYRDPLTGGDNFAGVHVTRAARLEPVTPPGEVYGSHAFAALAAAEGVTEFRCEYVGQTPLAKGFGTYPAYLVSGR